VKNLPEFVANYIVDTDRDLPSGGKPPVQFPLGIDGIGLGGPLLAIELSDGTTWFAVFAGGIEKGNFLSGVFHTPDPDTVCVVTKGTGYWVNTLSRTSVDIPTVPIRQVEATSELIMFVDFTTVSAFGKEGLIWQSDILVSDELSIQNVDEQQNVVTCAGWDAPTGVMSLSGSTCEPARF
jgi:hypothetical protein